MSETEPLLRTAGVGLGRNGFLKHVTVEPILVLFFIANGFYTETDSALIYDKSCLRLYDQDTCTNLSGSSSNFTFQKNQVQRTASQWRWYLDMCRDIPALFTMVAQGWWSDRFGRRLPLVFALAGEFLAAAAKLYNCIYMDADMAWLLLPFLLHGVCGCTYAVSLSAFSYISEVSSKESRTMRVIIAEAVIYTSGGFAKMVSGLIYDNTGYSFVYSFCAVVLTLALVYVFLFLPDIVPEQESNRGHKKNEPVSSKNKHCYQSASTDSLNCSQSETSSVFETDVKSEKDGSLSLSTTETVQRRTWTDIINIGTIFRKRSHNRRVYIVLATACVGLLLLCDTTTLIYLYLKKMLAWTQTTYTLYRGSSTLLRGLGLLVIVPIMKKIFFAMDTTIMISGALSKIAGSVVMAFAVSDWIPFLSAFVGILDTAPVTAIRGFISTLVQPWEQGRLFAVIGTLESLGYLASSSLYNYFLYPKTLDVYPGFCFLFSSALCLIPLAVFIWLHIDVKRRGTYQNLVEEPTIIRPVDSADTSATSSSRAEVPTLVASSSGSCVNDQAADSSF